MKNLNSLIILLFFICTGGQALSQLCDHDVYNANDLVAALADADEGETICIHADIDFDQDPVTFPLIIPGGVRLKGNFDILTNPSGAGTTLSSSAAHLISLHIYHGHRRENQFTRRQPC